MKYLSESKKNLFNKICKSKKNHELNKSYFTSVKIFDKFKNIVLMKQLADSTRNKGMHFAIDKKT